jgi:hypothetical protein
MNHHKPSYNTFKTTAYPTDFSSIDECVVADWFTVKFKWWVSCKTAADFAPAGQA